jgi:putative salt-induced outer membrane protein YdiY
MSFAANTPEGYTMTGRHFWIVLILMMIASTVFAQTPVQTPAPTPEPPPHIYTGNFGGGLALTNGNTSTRNFNLTGALVRDPKLRSVVKSSFSYLRGSTSDVLSVDRSAINLRHEYTMSKNTFIFDQLDYVRDQFKEIIFFWAPTAGIGYKLINTDATQFILDGGGGGVLEKNPGLDAKKSGSVTGDEKFQRKISSASTFTESLSAISKTNDFGDYLSTFTTGVTTTISGNIQLKVEFVDSYKNKPPNIGVKKNDSAFVTTVVLKY